MGTKLSATFDKVSDLAAVSAGVKAKRMAPAGWPPGSFFAFRPCARRLSETLRSSADGHAGASRSCVDDPRPSDPARPDLPGAGDRRRPAGRDEPTPSPTGSRWRWSRPSRPAALALGLPLQAIGVHFAVGAAGPARSAWPCSPCAGSAAATPSCSPPRRSGSAGRRLLTFLRGHRHRGRRAGRGAAGPAFGLRAALHAAARAGSRGWPSPARTCPTAWPSRVGALAAFPRLARWSAASDGRACGCGPGADATRTALGLPVPRRRAHVRRDPRRRRRARRSRSTRCSRADVAAGAGRRARFR